MKTQKNPAFKSVYIKLMVVLLLSAFTSTIVKGSKEYPRTSQYLHDSIRVEKSQISRIHKIRLFPNVTKEVLFFTAEGEEGKVYQLFVFDIEGKLSKQTQVRNRETTLLGRFEKGIYLYEVFSNDDRIENGSITIK